MHEFAQMGSYWPSSNLERSGPDQGQTSWGEGPRAIGWGETRPQLGVGLAMWWVNQDQQLRGGDVVGGWLASPNPEWCGGGGYDWKWKWLGGGAAVGLERDG